MQFIYLWIISGDIFSPQAHLFFSKQRGGLDEVGHLVEQQLLSPTDRWSKWEKQMYNQDTARARLCQDMPLARTEAGIELRRTWAVLRTDEVGLGWINRKGRLWGNQPVNKEVGSRNSPQNLKESHRAHKGEEWGLTCLSPLSPLSLLNPGLRTTKHSVRKLSATATAAMMLPPKTAFVSSRSGSSSLMDNFGFQWKTREKL